MATAFRHGRFGRPQQRLRSECLDGPYALPVNLFTRAAHQN